MALQITTNISVDFYDRKYILINAKQCDDVSRLISITCYDNGKLFNLSPSNHTAYVRFRKADGYAVLNSCRINNRGEVLVELTEQMLAAIGVCYVDLIIVEKGKAIVDIDGGKITTIDESPIISTMAFCIDVYEASVDNSLIESSYEFTALNEALKKADADYKEVIQLSRSYAIGDANDIRENEDFDNSKYYYRLSKSYAVGDADNVRKNEDADNSKYYSELSHASADSADESEANALSYMNTAKFHKDDAEAAQNAAEAAQNKAETAQSKAEVAQSAAETAEQNAEVAQSAAETAQSKAEVAQSAAETAQQKAEVAQQGAETARSALENAQSAAETAQQKAEDAQQGAETAEQNAEHAAEQAAQNAVDNVSALMNDYVIASKESATNAATSETNAKISETSAKTSEQNAEQYMNNAKVSEENSLNSEQNAKTYMDKSRASEINALNCSNMAQSYAIGGTGTRNGEDTDNAYYYYGLMKNIVVGLDAGFMHMGTILFSDLANVEKVVGYVYDICEDFVTDDRFIEGEGRFYTAGTNVYWLGGQWDCLSGASTPTATVNEVKDYLGI